MSQFLAPGPRNRCGVTPGLGDSIILQFALIPEKRQYLLRAVVGDL